MPKFVHSSGYGNPIPTTDAIIEYERDGMSGIILITRKNEPHGIALPGGFAEGGITLEQNVRKEALEETGLDFRVRGMLGVFDDPHRDPRGHMISVTYLGIGYGELRAGDDAKSAGLYSHETVRQLIRGGKINGLGLVFDHAQILEKYFQHQGYAL
ncbi:MAG TPA: NUDIX hydrolase [Candidatus Nanoarchaeia archaeon]|nr:NUDIX hydrolase [Candidatus Nanoarchaeia archaeon]